MCQLSFYWLLDKISQSPATFAFCLIEINFSMHFNRGPTTSAELSWRKILLEVSASITRLFGVLQKNLLKLNSPFTATLSHLNNCENFTDSIQTKSFLSIRDAKLYLQFQFGTRIYSKHKTKLVTLKLSSSRRRSQKFL